MDKVELLKFVLSLPDDVQVMPIDHKESVRDSDGWKSLNATGLFGGLYNMRVRNELRLELRFTTEYEGQFKRTYENAEGEFRNVRRVR